MEGFWPSFSLLDLSKQVPYSLQRMSPQLILPFDSLSLWDLCIHFSLNYFLGIDIPGFSASELFLQGSGQAEFLASHQTMEQNCNFSLCISPRV
jgi:hypothetical protein